MFGLFRRLGSRDAKPNPDAFWSDKWGWMDEASPADLLAVVRRGVESGTIKGRERSWCLEHQLPFAPPPIGECAFWSFPLADPDEDPHCRPGRVVVISVSDRGEE